MQELCPTCLAASPSTSNSSLEAVGSATCKGLQDIKLRIDLLGILLISGSLDAARCISCCLSWMKFGLASALLLLISWVWPSKTIERCISVQLSQVSVTVVSPIFVLLRRRSGGGTDCHQRTQFLLLAKKLFHRS
jgi:hypothetical protein